jgi:hypothetical protein
MGLICSSGIGGSDASLPGGHGPHKGQRQGGVEFNGVKKRVYLYLIASEGAPSRFLLSLMTTSHHARRAHGRREGLFLL